MSLFLHIITALLVLLPVQTQNSIHVIQDSLTKTRMLAEISGDFAYIAHNYINPNIDYYSAPEENDLPPEYWDSVLHLLEKGAVFRPEAEYLFTLRLDDTIAKSPYILPGNTGFVNSGERVRIVEDDPEIEGNVSISEIPLSERMPEVNLEPQETDTNASTQTVGEMLGVASQEFATGVYGRSGSRTMMGGLGTNLSSGLGSRPRTFQ